MTSNSSIFSGTSRYAQDFTQIIDRAVGIASLPLSQLNNQKNALNLKSAAFNALATQFSGLRTAVENLGVSLSRESLQTTISEPTVVNANVQAGALPGTYQIEVLSPGSQSQSLSKDSLTTVTDPYTQSLSASTAFTLTVDGITTEITPESNDLASLAKAINASGAGVSASIVNIGGNDAPDYRLTLKSEKLGPVAISLSDGSQEILDSLTSGTLASYKINGLPSTAISSTSRTVTIGLGLTVDLLKAGTTEVEVAQNADSVAESLAAFVTAYNATVAALDSHRGTNAGALRGEPALATLSDELRQLRLYAGTNAGGLNKLQDVGITIDKNGIMSFDESTFDEAAAGGLQRVMSFLESSSTEGFLKSATAMLDKLQDSATGVLPSAISGIAQQLVRQDQLIAENQDRIDLMRDTLMTRMAAADALIASLEQQVTIFTGLFEAQSNANNR
jgi:flagellar hook-associated protein 2